MSRLPRVFVPGLPLHVTLRGNDRQDIAHCDADRRRLLADLRLEASANGLAIHAYVLMTNHVHLLGTGREATSLPRTVQGLGRRYVAYFNLRHQRSGTLWEGRYRASLVASDTYLVACHRYIDLNPVRAGLSSRPADYPWSSHRHYALGQPDALVTPHSYWREASPDEEARSILYRAMFEEPMSPAELAAVREASRKGVAIGDRAACQRLERVAGVRITPARMGRPAKKQESLV